MGAVKVGVAVVGNGLIGMSTAAHLHRRGLSVAVVGKATEGQASSAAVGMLTPACEYDPWMPYDFYDLLRAGLQYYPHFLADFRLTAEAVGYRRTDFTLLDLCERTDSIQDRVGWMSEYGIDHTWCDPAEVCRLEPSLSPLAFRGGIRIRGEALVNPRALLAVLGKRAEYPVLPGGLTGVVDHGGGFRLNTVDGAEVVAQQVVIAAGCWSGAVGRMFGLDIPVCPVKGQIIRLVGKPGLIGSVVFMPGGGCGSVVERLPGEYVVGTSEEYLRPVSDNTAAVVGAILTRLCAVLPVAGEWRIDEMWTGFRPMTADELPIIGQADDPRITVATGHHRNGVLLAALTGRLVSALVAQDDPGIALDRFAYGRQQRPHTRFADKY